jgi:hypothetical protein
MKLKTSNVIVRPKTKEPLESECMIISDARRTVISHRSVAIARVTKLTTISKKYVTSGNGNCAWLS